MRFYYLSDIRQSKDVHTGHARCKTFSCVSQSTCKILISILGVMTPSIPSAEVAMKLALVGRYSYTHFTAAGIMISEAIVMNASYQFHMYKNFNRMH